MDRHAEAGAEDRQRSAVGEGPCPDGTDASVLPAGEWWTIAWPTLRPDCAQASAQRIVAMCMRGQHGDPDQTGQADGPTSRVLRMQSPLAEGPHDLPQPAVDSGREGG